MFTRCAMRGGWRAAALLALLAAGCGGTGAEQAGEDAGQALSGGSEVRMSMHAATEAPEAFAAPPPRLETIGSSPSWNVGGSSFTGFDDLGQGIANVGDVNGDGIDDFAFNYGRNNYSAVYKGGSSGPTQLSLSSGSTYRRYSGCDVNNNGRNDVAIGMSLFYGTDNGLTDSYYVSLGNKGVAFCAGDVTGDGYGDVFYYYADYSNNRYRIRLAKGSSTGLQGYYWEITVTSPDYLGHRPPAKPEACRSVNRSKRFGSGAARERLWEPPEGGPVHHSFS